MPLPSKLSFRKKLIFAMIPLCLLAAGTEVVLRAIDYRSPNADPYESFVLHRPLFEARGDLLQTNPSRVNYFRPQEFARKKAPGTVRCVVCGGSVTYGYLLEDPLHQAYPYVLAQQFEKVHPQTRFEIINCGGLAYATYRLVGIIEECLAYDPDLVIVMSGHNEFLEPRLYADLLDVKQSFWYESRIVRLIRQWTASRMQQDFQLPRTGDEKHMVLASDYIEERFIVRDVAEYESTADHFSRNLGRMIALCRERGVPIVLCTEASNIRDWAPFQTLPGGSLNVQQVRAELGRVNKLISEGKHTDALKAATEILQDDPGSAAFHFLAAKCLDALGRPAAAKPHYIQARDTDAFPHRSISLLNNRVRAVAKAESVPLFDAEDVLMRAARDAIPGFDLFVDQCHPNPDGHAIIAKGLQSIIESQVARNPATAPDSIQAH